MEFMDFEKSEQLDFVGYLRESVTKEQLEVIAAEKQCSLLIPKPNELFLDVDTIQQLDRVNASLKVLDDNGIIYQKKELFSKSGNRHIIISLPFDVSDELRVAFQAALGSDPKRELLACLRILAGVEVVTVFFRPIKRGD